VNKRVVLLGHCSRCARGSANDGVALCSTSPLARDRALRAVHRQHSRTIGRRGAIYPPNRPAQNGICGFFLLSGARAHPGCLQEFRAIPETDPHA
jgi:hypothetical protein